MDPYEGVNGESCVVIQRETLKGGVDDNNFSEQQALALPIVIPTSVPPVGEGKRRREEERNDSNFNLQVR
jgi:hypothetical protein